MYTLSPDSFIKNPNIYLLPGVTPETIATCSQLLQQNHEHHHVFLNSQKGFHNHLTHHLLAALGLGASSNTLKQIYEKQEKMQQPLLPLHKKQDFDVEKCLGDDNYYHDYLEFFTKESNNEKYHGKIEDFIEDYLFNKDYLTLTLNGAYHSFIHLGYALEFQSKVMAIEGLAMAAVDRVSVKDILNQLTFDQNKNGDKTAMEILELIFKDQRFDGIILDTDHIINARHDKFMGKGGAALIAEYAEMWKYDILDARRAGVLVHAAVIRPKKAPRLDFFLMHATTSSLFYDIFVHSLKKQENQFKLMKAKIAVDLLFYCICGRPKLNVNYLCNEYQVSEEHSYSDAQNPWLPLIDKCLTHPDEHLPKTIQALVYAEKFDNVEEKDKLPYLKIAQMVMDALFPADEKDWVRTDILSDHYWKTVEDL